MPPFKPVASHLRASFVDLLVHIGTDHRQHIWLTRDAMGLCWIHFTEPFPFGKVSLIGYTESSDQTFRSWFPLQTQIQTRASRIHLLNALLTDVVSVASGDVLDYCLPRVAVYRIGTSANLEYHYEVIDASNQEWIAEHIGNRERLLSDDILSRGFLQPPHRLKIPTAPVPNLSTEEDDSHPESDDLKS